MRYHNDPRWITVKYTSTCKGCNTKIPRGAEAFYYPSDHELFCNSENCGQAAYRDFEAHRVDEDGY